MAPKASNLFIADPYEYETINSDIKGTSMKIHLFKRILVIGLVTLVPSPAQAVEESDLIAILQSSAGAPADDCRMAMRSDSSTACAGDGTSVTNPMTRMRLNKWIFMDVPLMSELMVSYS